jgi:hypothetical protein
MRPHSFGIRMNDRCLREPLNHPNRACRETALVAGLDLLARAPETNRASCPGEDKDHAFPTKLGRGHREALQVRLG